MLMEELGAKALQSSGTLGSSRLLMTVGSNAVCESMSSDANGNEWLRIRNYSVYNYNWAERWIECHHPLVCCE